MKRYTITNPTNGTIYDVYTEGDLALKPEYGNQPNVVTTDISADEAAFEATLTEIQDSMDRLLAKSNPSLSQDEKDLRNLLLFLMSKYFPVDLPSSVQFIADTPPTTIQAISNFFKGQ